MPLRRGGVWRKRWRYLGAFCDQLLICAARIQVGPLGQTFWVVWDRERRLMVERTRLLAPGARGEVWTENLGGDGLVLHAEDQGSLVRVEGHHPEAGEVRAFLRAGGGEWVEAVCPNEAGEYVWTRKRADIPVAEFGLGQPSLDEVFLALTGRPAEDQTQEKEEEELQEEAA